MRQMGQEDITVQTIKHRQALKKHNHADRQLPHTGRMLKLLFYAEGINNLVADIHGFECQFVPINGNILVLMTEGIPYCRIGLLPDIPFTGRYRHGSDIHGSAGI